MRRIPGLMVAAGRGASCSLSRVVLVAALVVAAVSVVTPGVSDAAAEVVTPVSVSPELAPAQCGFIDVTDEDYFARGTCWLKLNDITTGLDGNPEIYGPNGVVNRAQMAAFLWRANGRPETPTECGFTDVSPEAFFAEGTCWLKANNITTGLDGNPEIYGPEVVVNRAQMAAFLWRASGKPDAPAECGFVDVPPGAFFAEGTCWLKANNITTGLDGDPTVFGPNVVVNRAQMAAFLWRDALATQPDPPSAPTIVSVVGGDRQLTVGFTAPDADGGSPVTNYEYLLDDGSGDGSLDPSFVVGSGFGSSVYSLAVQPDGRVVAVGVFRTFDGVSANRIVRLDADGGRDGSFVVGAGFDGETWDVALTGDGGVVVGGFFDGFDGVFRRNIAKLGSDGSLDGSFVVGSGFDDGVLALAAQDDGKVIAGGAFRSYGGVSAGGLVRLNADGSRDTAFDVGTGFNGDVWDVAVLDDGDVVVAGSFTTFDGVSAIRLVRLNADGSRDTAFDVGAGFNGEVRTVAVDSQGRLVAGGLFTTFGAGSANRVVRLEPDGSRSPSFAVGQGFDGPVYSVAVQADDSALIGGQFTSVDGTSVTGLARLNADGSLDTGFDPGTGLPGGVLTVIARPDGKVLVGGSFTAVNDEPINRIARLGSTHVWTAMAPEQVVSPLVITGVGNAIAYTVRIRAVNADGFGETSNAVSGTPLG